jgi:hypothetical protein
MTCPKRRHATPKKTGLSKNKTLNSMTPPFRAVPFKHHPLVFVLMYKYVESGFSAKQVNVKFGVERVKKTSRQTRAIGGNHFSGINGVGKG